jgi:hypothetical protein
MAAASGNEGGETVEAARGGVAHAHRIDATHSARMADGFMQFSRFSPEHAAAASGKRLKTLNYGQFS